MAVATVAPGLVAEGHLVYFLTYAVRELDIGASCDRMQTAEVRLQNEIRELPAQAEAED